MNPRDRPTQRPTSVQDLTVGVSTTTAPGLVGRAPESRIRVGGEGPWYLAMSAVGERRVPCDRTRGRSYSTPLFKGFDLVLFCLRLFHRY